MEKDTNSNHDRPDSIASDKQDTLHQERLPKAKKKIALVGLVVLVVVLAGVAFALTSNRDKGDNRSAGDAQQYASSDNPWLKDCVGDQRVAMSHLPMDMDEVQSITPLGLTAGAHVTPIDHLYFFPKDMNNRDAAPVYAMADGYVVDISKREVNVDRGTERPAEYRIAIQHSCQTVSYFDLMTSLDETLLAEFEKSGGTGSYRIAVKAGQEMGRVGAQSLDTAVYNFSMTLPGFISPEKYKGEFWKVHTDDFFSYFSDSHKQEMQAKNIRKTAQPLSGKIDYDQAGKLIGNWFREGTDYFGDGSSAVSSDGKHGYWSGHLAIFPFVGDGSTIIVSFGEYGDGAPQAFAVKGNSPDPATVDAGDGVVAYELVQAPQPTPTGMNAAGNQVVGTVLFQVLDGEKLKMEVFPGKTKTQAAAFTGAALTYER